MTKVPPKPLRLLRPVQKQKLNKAKHQVEGTDEDSLALGRSSEQEKTHEELLRDREALGGEVSHEIDDRELKEQADRQHTEEQRAEKKGSTGDNPDKEQRRLKSETHLALKKKLDDGFEKRDSQQLKTQLKQAQKIASAIAPPLSPGNKPPDAMTLLHAAQDKGVYFQEEGGRGGLEGQPEEEVEPLLLEAVEEAKRLLADVRGILRIVPGRNEDGGPVVLIVAERGFGEASLHRVPPAVKDFPTLLALPYELLPLRRERPL